MGKILISYIIYHIHKNKNQGLINVYLGVCLLAFPLVAQSQAVLLSSSDLPIFIINTNGNIIQNEPRITADLTVLYNGLGKRNNISDAATHFKGKIGIELRGSSSLDLSPKKPFGFETRNADGSNLNVSLLGLPAENDWVLLAPYSDKSLMRDVLIHHLANQIMPYSSRTRYCEVVVNNEYLGVYALMEKIKRDNKRVDIKDILPTTQTGDGLTGGYILKIDKTTGSTPQGGFNSKYPNGNGLTPKYTYYQFDHPEANVINAAQKLYISNFIHSFEDRFSSSDFKHPTNGYRNYVDEKSMIDFLLLNEIGNNVDGYRLSTYLYKDVDSKSNKLKFGPIWDFNLAFGNANYCSGGETNVLAFEFNNRCPNDFWQISFYWQKAMTDHAFFEAARSRWAQLRKSTFLEQNMIKTVDSLQQTLKEAQARNFNRWNILSIYVWPNLFIGGSYQAELDYLKDWIRKRIKFLDTYFNYVATVPIPQDAPGGISFFPNPSNQYISIQLAPQWSRSSKYLIYNSLGVRVYEGLLRSDNKVDLSKLYPGPYHLCIINKGQLLLTKTFTKL